MRRCSSNRIRDDILTMPTVKESLPRASTLCVPQGGNSLWRPYMDIGLGCCCVNRLCVTTPSYTVTSDWCVPRSQRRAQVKMHARVCPVYRSMKCPHKLAATASGSGSYYWSMFSSWVVHSGLSLKTALNLKYRYWNAYWYFRLHNVNFWSHPGIRYSI